MSNIFDALQRSESEQTGSDSSLPTKATELLKRAERRAVSKWETEAQPQQVDVIEDLGCDTLNGLQVQPPDATSKQGSVAVTVSPTGGGTDFFDQIQSLKAFPTPQERLVCLTDSEGPAAEAFRLLGVRLRDLQQHRSLKRVLITSTVPQEGKSMVAANLACTLALRMSKRTLLLEGDLRRPSLMRMFGVEQGPGLCECLRGDCALTASIYHLEEPNLWILPAGSVPSNALDLLQAKQMSRLMEQLNERFEWIIIDSPPMLPLADTSVWVRLAEGILLVTREGITEKRQLRRGLEVFEANKLIGAILNSSRHSDDSDYYYYRSPKVSKTSNHPKE